MFFNQMGRCCLPNTLLSLLGNKQMELFGANKSLALAWAEHANADTSLAEVVR